MAHKGRFDVSTQTYGRSVARQTLADIRQVNLWKERCLSFGPLARGQTVYRKKAGDWRVLPDPEKAR